MSELRDNDIDEIEITLDGKEIRGWTSSGAGRRLVVREFIEGDGCPMTHADANAALIVRAINSHAELLAAAKQARLFAADNMNMSRKDMIDVLTAAIVKAESKTP